MCLNNNRTYRESNNANSVPVSSCMKLEDDKLDPSDYHILKYRNRRCCEDKVWN